MSKKPKPTPADPKNTLKLESNEPDHDKFLAQTALRPSVKGAIAIKQWSQKLGDLDLSRLIEELRTQSNLANDGKLARGEAMLMTQAHTLDAIFNELARRAALNMGEYMNACDTYLRLALKAQSQCRTTIETLAEMKNPRPVAFVKQANIANNQQINNGPQPPGELSDQYAQAHAGAREIKNQPNELLETQHGKRVDSGTTGQAIGGDSALEAVGAVDRSKDKSR